MFFTLNLFVFTLLLKSMINCLVSASSHKSNIKEKSKKKLTQNVIQFNPFHTTIEGLFAPLSPNISTCKFSILPSVHFLWNELRELVKRSKHSPFCDNFIISHNLFS